MAAVDLGAQSGRVALGSFDGDSLTLTEVHRFANVPVEEEGALRWDFETLWANTLDGLRKASAQVDLCSVGVDSWAVDFGLLGAEGQLLANPTHYRDAGRAAAVAEVYARVPPRELYERTGIQLLPINTVFELASLAKRGSFDRAETLLLMPDLINHQLCGSRTTERTNASTTQCLDITTGAWAADLLDRLNIPTRLLPPIAEPGTVLGQAGRELGLGALDVVAVATHDTGSAVAAVPFASATAAFLSVGTWSLVGLELNEPVVTEAAFAANLTNEAGYGGAYRLLRNVTGLWLLHECRRSWGTTHSWEELVESARSAPALRSLVDPDESMFAEPGEMPARIAEFCIRTGQPAPDSVGATVRCILESLVLGHARAIRQLEEVTGRSISVLNLVGGGAQNDLLCQWTADATGLPVLAGPEEATLVGNLIVQAIAFGELASLDEGRDLVRRSFPARYYEPSSASLEWSEARERFTQDTGLTRQPA